jgi:hypothetical protein
MAAKRWQICNVLATGAEARRLWHFDAKGKTFKLDREYVVRGSEVLPDLVQKSWGNLWQPRLNVACLPPDRVFLRAAQFPNASFSETLAMVDLQMEKLSPMPTGQTVWTMHCLPHPDGTQQTVVVTIAAREAVEAFLGKLESQGYLADRLECPALDLLLATEVKTDGAWIYPEAMGGVDSAMVAWWYGGVLRSIDMLALPTTSERAAVLREQLLQMAWAGEIEGWLTSAPRWHMIAPKAVAQMWILALREGLGEAVEIIEPPASSDLAVRTALRAAAQDAASTLLPPEYAARYRQRFLDRLWMRGLGALVVLYLIGVAVYFSFLGVAWWRTNGVEQQVKGLGGAYTNSMQMRARYDVLKERQDLKYAALDCWRLLAERWPEGATLEGFNFVDGQRLTVNGTAPQDAVSTLIDFNNEMRKAKGTDGKEIFKPDSDPLNYRSMAGGAVSWNFSLELKRSEVVEGKGK